MSTASSLTWWSFLRWADPPAPPAICSLATMWTEGTSASRYALAANTCVCVSAIWSDGPSRWSCPTGFLNSRRKWKEHCLPASPLPPPNCSAHVNTAVYFQKHAQSGPGPHFQKTQRKAGCVARPGDGIALLLAAVRPLCWGLWISCNKRKRSCFIPFQRLGQKWGQIYFGVADAPLN